MSLSLGPGHRKESRRELAAELAPHFFAPGWEVTSAAVVDLVALGLAAGWRVGAPITDADMATGYTLGSRDVDLWIDTVLRNPCGRSALLSPKASVIAVGVAFTHPDDAP